MPYPTGFVIYLSCPIILLAIIFLSCGWFTTLFGWICFPITVILSLNAIYIGDGLYVKYYHPNKYRPQKILKEKVVSEFLSGNVFIVPAMLLSLLRTETIEQFATLEKEIKERKITDIVIGQKPPNARLSTPNLTRTVDLDDLLKRKPITVLNFGNYT